MSSIGIVFATKTKHSQRYAEAIGKSLHVQPENAADRPAPRRTDLLFIIGGIYGGQSLPELLEYVQKLDGSQVKSAALVTSNASKRRRQDAVRSLLAQKGIEVLDEIICPGNFLFLRAGHPNEADVRLAVEFAQRLSEKITG